MLTNKERITALKCNLKNFDWDVFQQFRLEKEDAEALLELLNSGEGSGEDKPEEGGKTDG